MCFLMSTKKTKNGPMVASSSSVTYSDRRAIVNPVVRYRIAGKANTESIICARNRLMTAKLRTQNVTVVSIMESTMKSRLNKTMAAAIHARHESVTMENSAASAVAVQAAQCSAQTAGL